MSVSREKCFVIMPIGQTTDKHTEEYWEKHFNTFLKPLIEENPHLLAHRSEALRGDILRQIITDLVTARVVVADLTDHNCNVYWELGVRQSFKHGTITIAEAKTKLPFDIGGKGTLFYYPRNHLKLEAFRKSFKQATNDCLAHPERPDSHVLETLGGRGTLFEIFRRDEAIRRLDALVDECDRNSRLLERVLDMARKNQKKPEEREFPTHRFRVAAVELLMTNRYVDEEPRFFSLAESCANSYYAFNGQLDSWEIDPDSTEAWFLKSEEPGKTYLRTCRNKVAAARDKLSKRP